jgi:hypothetical protein
MSHPEVARAYGELKRQLAARFPNDIDAYMGGKDSFVKQYEAEGLAWCAGRSTAVSGVELQVTTRGP